MTEPVLTPIHPVNPDTPAATLRQRLLAAGQEPIPAWVPCSDCENHQCSIHGCHAHDCPCPELEFWDSELGINPYEQGGDLTPEWLEFLKKQFNYEEE